MNQTSTKTKMDTMRNILRSRLELATEEGLLRALPDDPAGYDFNSNDYLSFARSPELKQKIQDEVDRYPQYGSGSTGSRLISGNLQYIETLEKEIAGYHGTDDGLIFASGYAANMAFFSTIPQKGDTVICDEYIHASAIDGVRLSYTAKRRFKHNDLYDLEKQLKMSSGHKFVAVESLYSMDGDLGDLINIAELCKQYKAYLVVDEAHACGVWGTGLVDTLNIQHLVYARVVTFGKALGVHGAIVIGADPMKEYLVNFARPFIYSTAPPFQHYAAIKMAYQHLLANPQLQDTLHSRATLFKDNMPPQYQVKSSINPSPIQCIFINSNVKVLKIANDLRGQGFNVTAIRSPSVPRGYERLRICLHCHNTEEQVLSLCKFFNNLYPIDYVI
jgi:8-amino-7-oxononanoate synthase